MTFPYSVASGDPYSDSVILWTMPRKLDLEGLYGGNAYPPICVNWIVSTGNTTSAFQNSIVSHGQAITTQDVGYSVKVEAGGLKAYTKYY